MNMNSPLVTVVIPIYKVEKQLNRCIDSVLGQTYKNLEIILVDDGSPDNCPQICDEYAKKDSRIVVVHKANEGLGMARNTGIEFATGKYICFFDSDDYIEFNTIEECCTCAERDHADLVCFGHIEENNNGKVRSYRIPNVPTDIFVKNDILNKLIPMTLSHDAKTGEDWNLSLSAWCGFFSMNIIKKSGWRFVSEREIISEDIYSVLEYYWHTEKIAFIKKPFYHYVLNDASLSNVFRADRYERLKVFAEKMKELLISKNSEQQLEQRLYTIFLGLTIGALKNIALCNLSFKVKYNAMKNVILDCFMQDVLSKSVYKGEPFAKKMLFWLIKRKMVLLSFLMIEVKSKMD